MFMTMTFQSESSSSRVQPILDRNALWRTLVRKFYVLDCQLVNCKAVIWSLAAVAPSAGATQMGSGPTRSHSDTVFLTYDHVSV